VEAADRHASPVQILPEDGHLSLHFDWSDSVSLFCANHLSLTASDCRAAAAAKCRMPLAHFEVLVGGEAMDDEATSESADLFSRPLELKFIESEEEAEAEEPLIN
jgi:hypothetical protein